MLIMPPSGRWAFFAGRDWSCAQLWAVRLAWDRYHAPEGVIPYRRELWLEWTPIRLWWSTFPRAWGRTDRRHDCGAWDASFWTGRTREFIGWAGGLCWGKR